MTRVRILGTRWNARVMHVICGRARQTANKRRAYKCERVRALRSLTLRHVDIAMWQHRASVAHMRGTPFIGAIDRRWTIFDIAKYIRIGATLMISVIASRLRTVNGYFK
jgi:hypothetical protein